MKEIIETLEFAKMSIVDFKAEALLTPELIDEILTVFSKVEEMQKNNTGLKAALDQITGTFTRERMSEIAYDALHEFGGESQ